MKGPRPTSPIVVALVALIGAVPATAQKQGSVIGVVVEESTQTPLQAATVSLVDADLSAVSRSDGQFELTGLPEGEWPVKIEHLSHVSIVEPVVVSSGEVTFVQFELSPVAFVLDQLRVLVDPSVAPPEGTAYSDFEPTQREFNSSAMDLLSARFPSLSITGPDRSAGQAKRVQLRGVRSVVVGNTPALYVDGVAAEMSLLAAISSSEVRSIRVLRGPSASSAYPNASNGVIVVETRRGRIVPR